MSTIFEIRGETIQAIQKALLKNPCVKAWASLDNDLRQQLAKQQAANEQALVAEAEAKKTEAEAKKLARVEKRKAAKLAKKTEARNIQKVVNMKTHKPKNPD